MPGARGSPAVVLPRGAGDFLSGCRFLRSSCRRCALCVAAQGATRFLPPGGAFPPRGGLYAFAPSRDVSRGHVTQGQPVRSARAGPGSVWRKEGTGSRRTPAGPGRAVGSGAGPGRAEPSRARPSPVASTYQQHKCSPEGPWFGSGRFGSRRVSSGGLVAVPSPAARPVFIGPGWCCAQRTAGRCRSVPC